MKLNLCNLQKVKELCSCNPNEVITIDDINFCWVINVDDVQNIDFKVQNIDFKDGCFRVDFANGWETLYI